MLRAKLGEAGKWIVLLPWASEVKGERVFF